VSARDEELESLIQAAWQALMDSACRESKVAAAQRMKELVAKRSPERVRQLEIERGLRAP
jgi:hypothetical protein